MTHKPYIIGITGGSGSGKTRIIHELRELFSEEKLCIISQDEYYHPRERQVWDDAGYQNFDLPEAIDDSAFTNDIKKLINGHEVRKEQYVFNNPDKEPVFLLFKPAPIIIVEGLFVFYFPEIRELLDLKLFIDAEDVIKLKRRIIRDAGERNYPLEDVLHRYEFHVLPSYKAHIEPFKDQAHLVINNHTSYFRAIEVLAALIEVKSKKIID
ncbi:MAG: uridine kinase [Saprospiraceae bacterium]|uniref:Uridine kinase n=1 Tax=Candidatus Opimibacter skivensis TaxID=2982028 RepID=A0A9D7XRF9_9BACT|nr:uridine kinase [Candidatus Opimibacter skivensis]